MRNLIRRLTNRRRKPTQRTVLTGPATLGAGLKCNRCGWSTPIVGSGTTSYRQMHDHLHEAHGIDIPQMHRHRCESIRLSAMAIEAVERGAETTSAHYRERAQWHRAAADQIATQIGDGDE